MVFGAVSGIFLTFLCSLLFRMRPVSNRAVSGASPSVPTPAVAFIYDASTPVPFAGDEGQARPVLRERKVALPW